MSQYKNNRRQFLKLASLAGAGLSTSASSLFNLNNIGALSSAQASHQGEYKALVCVYLGGGADSYNMLIPRGDSEYAEYLTTRSNYAIPKDQILAINPPNLVGKQLGLHPNMVNLQNFFNQGKAAWISNIGTLINPVTKTAYQNGTIPLPMGLFSHSDQSNQWMTGIPQGRGSKGWAGRMSDLLYDINTEQKISMNCTFAGTNLFQKSDRNIEFTLESRGATTLNSYNPDETYNKFVMNATRSIDKMVAHDYNDPFKNTYNQLFSSAIENSIRFNRIIATAPTFERYTDNYLSNIFHMITKVIASSSELGFKRQIFFLDFGGWDTHDSSLDEFGGLIRDLDTSLGEWQSTLDDNNMSQDVVTFTMSEFGRTLTSNGNGTDHAWGGNAFVMGGPVRGNRIYGDYPSLAMDSNIDVGYGSLIPGLANDLYFAELALWFGVPPSELHNVLPNLGNFYAQGSTNQPLGFLNI